MLDISDIAHDDFIEPAPALCDGGDECEACLRSNWPNILAGGCGCNDLAASLLGDLFPGNIKDGVLCSSLGCSVAFACQLDRDLGRMNLNPANMLPNKISVGARYWFFETLADCVDYKGFDLGGGYPTNRSGSLCLPLCQRRR